MDKESLATIYLSKQTLFRIYWTLNDLTKKALQAKAEEKLENLPFSVSTMTGKEFRCQHVFRAAREIESHLEKHQLAPIAREEFDAIEWLLSDDFSNEKSYPVELPLYLCNLIVDLFEDEDMARRPSEPNDWTPPSNFENGTDDERAVWVNYNEKKSN